MIRSNNLRKIYAAYSIAIGELFVAAMIIISWTVSLGVLTVLFRILGFIGAAMIPIVAFVFFRWRRKDNAQCSDEREQLVLTKAFALAGFTAITLLPVLLVLVCIFSNAAGWITLGFAAVVGGVMKMGTLYYNNKY